MKINHIYNILKQSKNDFNLNRKREGPAHQDLFRISGVQPTLVYLRDLEKLNIFKSISNFKEDYPMFWSWSEDDYSDTGGTTKNIINNLNIISNQIDSIKNILENFIPKDEGHIFSVKLPEYESLAELPNFYKNLNIMLTPLIQYFGDDTLTIHSFENGSKWNDFAVKNKATITLILLMITSGAQFYSSITEIQKNKLEIERTYQSMQDSSKNPDLLVDINDLFDKQIEDKYSEYVNNFLQIIEEENIQINQLGNTDGDIKNIVKRSFKSYQILVSEGTEFYGQINGDDEDLNKLVEQLDKTQALLNHTRNLELLKEDKTKSLLEPTLEEVGVSADMDDEEENDNDN